jgi:hypothetical protein
MTFPGPSSSRFLACRCGSAILCRTVTAIPPVPIESDVPSFTSSSSTATSATHIVCPCCMVLPPTACTSDGNDDVNIFHPNDGTDTSDSASFVDSGIHCHIGTMIAMLDTGAPIVPPDKADDSNLYGQMLVTMLADVDSKLEAVLPCAPNIAPSVLLSLIVPPGLAMVNTNGCSILVVMSLDLHSTLKVLLPTTLCISVRVLPTLHVARRAYSCCSPQFDHECEQIVFPVSVFLSFFFRYPLNVV